MAKSKARKEYERVYRNAKAKERRLKQNHGVSVDMALLTPTEWASAPNKKREINKLENFTNRNNRKYDYVSLGKESIKRTEYQKYAQQNKRTIDAINYHKKKTLKRVMDKPYLVYDKSTETVIQTDQKINDRITDLYKKSLQWQGNHSHKQGTKAQLEKYTESKEKQLENLKEMRHAQLHRANYLEKLDDYGRMLIGSPYESDYLDFMNVMRNLSAEEYEAFYYLADMGSISMIDYINDNEIGTPEGQEKIYRNMKAIKNSWDAVSRQISM